MLRRRFAKPSYRTRLVLGILIVLSISIGAPGAFVLRLYRESQLTHVLETELARSRHSADHLAQLLKLAEVMDPASVPGSREIILLYDHACDAGKSTVTGVSDLYRRHLDDLGLNAEQWTQSLDLFKACAELHRHPLATGERMAPTIVPFRLQLMVPYVGVLVQGPEGTRLVLISMEGFQSSTGNTLFLADANGRVFWAADGDAYLKDAFKLVELRSERLAAYLSKSARDGSGGVVFVGLHKEGLMAHSPVRRGWTMVSLADGPTVLGPLRYAQEQLALLALSFAFLLVFLARRAAAFLIAPLADLKEAAAEIATGVFLHRFKPEGDDEIATVKRAFNEMSDRLGELVASTAMAAKLERELNLTQQVQQLLLPPTRVDSLGQRLYSFTQSAEHCGGDWWGYLPIERPGQCPALLLLVGDVTGHGAPAALLTAVAKGSLSMLAGWVRDNPAAATDLAALLTHYSRAIWEAAHSSLTMSMFAVLVDPAEQVVYSSNAAHNFSYILGPSVVDGVPQKKPKMQVLGTSGTALGAAAAPTHPFKVTKTEWVPGSRLIMYTDGLTDFSGPDGSSPFDRRSFQRTLQSAAMLEGEEFIKEILKVRSRTKTRLAEDDDVTLVICELHPWTAPADAVPLATAEPVLLEETET